MEKIAEVTEKIASDVADELPDGGRLKDKAVQVEQICEEVEKAAEEAEAFIHKVLCDHNSFFPKWTSLLFVCICYRFNEVTAMYFSWQYECERENSNRIMLKIYAKL